MYGVHLNHSYLTVANKRDDFETGKQIETNGVNYNGFLSSGDCVVHRKPIALMSIQ